MAAGREIDAVLTDLVAAREQLERATAPADRAELRDRLHALRAMAAELRGTEVRRRSDDDLRACVARCRRELEALRDGRFDPSMAAGASGLGGGIDPALPARHNQRVDEVGQRARLEAELAEAVAELTRRAID